VNIKTAPAKCHQTIINVWREEQFDIKCTYNDITRSDTLLVFLFNTSWYI